MKSKKRAGYRGLNGVFPSHLHSFSVPGMQPDDSRTRGIRYQVQAGLFCSDTYQDTATVYMNRYHGQITGKPNDGYQWNLPTNPGLKSFMTHMFLLTLPGKWWDPAEHGYGTFQRQQPAGRRSRQFTSDRGSRLPVMRLPFQ